MKVAYLFITVFNHMVAMNNKFYLGDPERPKFFIDTEFIETPGTIELISIGLVSNNTGRKYYAESSEFDPSLANEFVVEYVFPQLGDASLRKKKNVIAKEVLSFIHDETETPEFWGYYSAYDWVVFCWLFGAMVDLPKGFPMLCMDLKHVLIELGNYNKIKIEVKPTAGVHNALKDAELHQEIYNTILGALRGHAVGTDNVAVSIYRGSGSVGNKMSPGFTGLSGHSLDRRLPLGFTGIVKP